MKHIKFTYVDSKTGISVASHPAENGPVFPAVDGLVFEWARESAYPTPIPEFFGTCSDTAFVMVDGVLDVLSQYDYDNMRADEMRTRPQPPDLQAVIVAAAQARLDDFARTRAYDGILSACTYAASTVPKFASEGQAAVNGRDATWAKLYEILAEVQAETRQAPNGFEDIEAELPVLEWPA